MSTEPRFEVWLHTLAGTQGEPASAALSRVFGIPEQSAQQLVAALPCVVKRDADIGLATRIIGALESIGGRAECKRMSQAPSGQRPAAPEPSNTAATLKLGTQDLHTLLPSAWAASIRAPGSAPAPAHASAPAPASAPAYAPAHAHSDSLDLAHAPTALPMPAPRISSRPVDAPLHPLEVSRRARERVSLRAPELFGAAGAPPVSAAPSPPVASTPSPASPLEVPTSSDSAVFEQVIALQPHHDWRHPLQLPADSMPSAPRMRAPSERARDPQRRSAAVSLPAHRRAAPASSFNPAKTALSILEQAEKNSWSSALQSHPMAGFLVILGGASALFLALIAAL